MDGCYLGQCDIVPALWDCRAGVTSGDAVLCHCSSVPALSRSVMQADDSSERLFGVRVSGARMNRGGGGRARGGYGYSYWFPTLRKNA